MVAYLLTSEKVQTDLKNRPEKVASARESPLLIAAQNGHTKCVTILQNGEVYSKETIQGEKLPYDCHSESKQAQNSLRDDITELKKDFSNFKEKMISHIKPADAVRDDIAKLKEDMAKLVQALTPRRGNGFQ